MPKSAHPTIPQPNFTDQEIAYLKAKVDRFIFLLDASAMPNQVKTAWLTLLPEMNLDQIDRLTAIVEKELDITLEQAKKQPEDEELLLKLKAIKERYDDRIATTDKKAMASLEKIEEELGG